MRCLLILLIFCNVAYAGNISNVPPLKDTEVGVQLYLQEIKDNFHKPAVTNTNPDGIRQGSKGEMVLLFTGTTVNIMINVDSATKWTTPE